MSCHFGLHPEWKGNLLADGLEKSRNVAFAFPLFRVPAEFESLVFIILMETDARFLREANQRETEKDCCNYEKQSGTIGVF